MTHCPACNREFPDDVDVCPTDGTAAHRVGERPDPLVGQTIRGRYRVLRKLGEGSSGTAYLAEQVKVRRSVVLKFLREDLAGDAILLERFRREARTLARLDPRYVTRVHDLDQTDDGRLFVVMEYLEGRTLRQVIEAEGQLTLSRTLALSVQIAEGLRVAHSSGVLHRDVKPQTVMVLTDETVKLTDFGVTARLRAPAGPADAGAPGLEYAPPEQLASVESEHGDLYSLGVVLYEMLTGALPAPTPGGEAGAKALAPPSQLRPGVPRHLDELVLQMLHPEAAQRPRDMAEVVRRLRSALAAARASGGEGDQTAIPPARPAWTTTGLRSSRPGGPPASSPPATPATEPPEPDGRSPAKEAQGIEPRLNKLVGTKRGRALAVSAALAVVAGLVVVTALALRSPSTPPGPATGLSLDSAGRPDPSPPAPASAAQAPAAEAPPGQTPARQAGAAQPPSAQPPAATAPAQIPAPAPAAESAAAVSAGQPDQAGDAARPPSSGGGGSPASPGASSPAPSPAISLPVAASPADLSPGATSPAAPSPAAGSPAPGSRTATDRPPAGTLAGKADGPDTPAAGRPDRAAAPGEGERAQPPPEARRSTPPSPAAAPPAAPRRADGPSTAAASVPDAGKLQAAVQDRLRAGGLLRDSATGPVGVSVEAGADGAVTLTGVLATRSDRERAIALTRAIPGVTAVRTRINVRESWGGS